MPAVRLHQQMVAPPRSIMAPHKQTAYSFFLVALKPRHLEGNWASSLPGFSGRTQDPVLGPQPGPPQAAHQVEIQVDSDKRLSISDSQINPRHRDSAMRRHRWVCVCIRPGVRLGGYHTGEQKHTKEAQRVPGNGAGGLGSRWPPRLPCSWESGLGPVRSDLLISIPRCRPSLGKCEPPLWQGDVTGAQTEK